MTHVYDITLERTIEQRALITVKADTLDEAIRLALIAARRKDAVTWKHHKVAATISAPADLAVDQGEPDPVLPFRGPGNL